MYFNEIDFSTLFTCIMTQFSNLRYLHLSFDGYFWLLVFVFIDRVNQGIVFDMLEEAFKTSQIKTLKALIIIFTE